MNNFGYARATDIADAVRQIAADPKAKFIAGGTNLIDLMKGEVERPTRIIDISRLPLTNPSESQAVSAEYDRSVRLRRLQIPTHGLPRL